MQIIANRAPIGFEAEFLNQRSENICYRGILMPFSSDGEAIDFIYGVINWKTVAGSGLASEPQPITSEHETDQTTHEDVLLLEDEAVFDELPPVQSFDAEPVDEAAFADQPQANEIGTPADSAAEHLVWEDGPSAEPDDLPETAHDAPPRVPFAWEEGPIADAEADEIAELVLDENAGLADRLWAARETAESVKAGEGRTRASLYRALSLAYDFAVAAQEKPDEYAELLEESGVKAQARAPMTPIVKLVFGVDYDKARLTEFAAALSFAQRQQIGQGEFKSFIEKQPGGLKALVAAERQARRPESKPDSRGEAARAKLRSAPALSLADIAAPEEFAVVITRRTADGSHEAVAVVEDEAIVERAIRKVA
jgi:hypothetical protein